MVAQDNFYLHSLIMSEIEYIFIFTRYLEIVARLKKMSLFPQPFIHALY